MAAEVDEIDKYVWPFLRDNLAFCHCLFSRRSVTITPVFPPVDLLPTFEDCPRRIYMSATIADDSEIVRAFGGVRGRGRQADHIHVARRRRRAHDPDPRADEARRHGDHADGQADRDQARRGKETGCRDPRRRRAPAADKWTDVATYPEHDEGSRCPDRPDAVGGKSFGPIVLANRYDGIDLAGNACRFLVMDNLPQGTSDYDLYRMNVVADSAVSSLLAQRIEQGIGRGWD